MKIKKEHVAVLEMRSHIAWYIKGLQNCVEIKNECFKIVNKNSIEHYLTQYISYHSSNQKNIEIEIIS